MGLLDDAIREHLELKRRRGADPAEIAHEEQAALTPRPAPEETAEPAVDEHLIDDLPGVGDIDDPLADGGTPEEISLLGQETAEIDMEAVMGEDVLLAHDAAGLDDDLSADDDGGVARGIGGEPLPEQVPGQERISFE